jgi:HSP20 family protein
MITVSGEKKEEHEEKHEKYHHREFSYGSFSRSFTIPEGVEADKIKANFDNGVLHLMIPKNHHVEAAGNAKKISIA